MFHFEVLTIFIYNFYSPGFILTVEEGKCELELLGEKVESTEATEEGWREEWGGWRTGERGL